MNDRDDIGRLLDPEGGLRCLPRILKEQLRREGLLDRPDEDLARYRRRRLALVERLIEPLAGEAASGGNDVFGRLCDRLRDADDWREWRRGLGLPADHLDDDFDWLRWACDEQDDPSVGLHCLAVAWAFPVPADDDWSPRDDISLRYLMDFVSFLAGPGQFAMWVEGWLGILPRDYRDPGAIRERLSAADGPLAYVHEATTKALVLIELSKGLLFVDDRRNRAAAALLEGWLGLEARDPRDVEAVRDRLSADDCPLNDIDSLDKKTLLIASLAEHLRCTADRGARAALAVLEGYLGLRRSDLVDAESVRSRLDGEDWPLEGLEDGASGLHTSVMIMVSTANALMGIEDRGPREAVALLEGFLGVGPQDYFDPEGLWRRIRARFDLSGRDIKGLRVHPRPISGADDERGPDEKWGFFASLTESLLILPFAQALLVTVDRGPHAAVALLEGWLGLRKDDYDDAGEVRRRLQGSHLPFARLRNRVLEANVIVDLAHSLCLHEDRGMASGRALIEGWLGLRPEDFADAASVSRRLRADDCPLSSIASDTEMTAANIICALARGLLGSGESGRRMAVTLLEGWLGLQPSDYAGVDSVRRRLRSADCPLSSAGGPITGSQVIFFLAGALTYTKDRGPRPALVLLEGWLEGPMASFGEAPRLEGVPATNRIILVHIWLESAWAGGATEPEIEATIEALVRYIVATRDGLDSFAKRKDFLAQAARIMSSLRDVTFLRADRLRSAGDPAAADREELRLLEWTEQFRNRTLIEEMLDRAGRPPGGDGSALIEAVPLETWPLLHVERPRWLRRPGDRPSALGMGPGDASEGLLAPPAALGLYSPTPTPTDVAPAGMDAHDDADRRHPADPLAAARHDELAAALARRTRIKDLLPDRTVWIGTLFDEEGALRWWAVRRDGGEVRLLARGRSAAGASERLVGATLAFDLAVLAAWRAHDGIPLPTLVRPWFDALGHFLGRPELLRTWFPAIPTEPTAGRMERFAALMRGSPQFAAFMMRGMELAADPQVVNGWPGAMETAIRMALHLALTVVGTPDELPIGMIEAWRHLTETWARPKDPGEARALGLRLRTRLDEASGRYLEAVAREWDLVPLFASAVGREWQETDVLLRAEGPLLAAPLPWLPFGPGREPLFRQVASTSTVVSLALRAVSEEEAARSPGPGRTLLSCQFLEAGDWRRMPGLARLHEEILRRFREWTIWGLGDLPEARTEVLLSLLRRRPFDVVVVGGHGDPGRAGVKLKDTCWCGEGADLSPVDLLVFVACAVGRVSQDGDRDIEGLYSRLLVHRGRSVIAARWMISDAEAARFIAEVLDRYRLYQEAGTPIPFARARALNWARRTLVGPVHDESKVSFHLASAFELYGLG